MKEKEYENRVWELTVLQTTHTPQSKKGAKQLSKYIKDINRRLKSQVPWIDAGEKGKSKKPSRMDRKAESRVIIQGGLPKDAEELFKGLEGKIDIERRKE